MRKRLGVGVLLIHAIAGQSSFGAEVTVKPVVASKIVYDSNPRLRPFRAQEVFISKSEAFIETVYAEPTYNISLTPKFRLNRYTEETDLDSEDYFVNLSGSKFLERHQFTTEFDYEREASIETERDDSGIFNVNVPRTTFSLSSSWAYNINDRASA